MGRLRRARHAIIMKSLRCAWDHICSFENILLGYRRAARHKRWRHAVLAFEREKNLLILRDAPVIA
jgi:hypothetical protein